KTRFMEKTTPFHPRKSKMEKKFIRSKPSLNTENEDEVTNIWSNRPDTRLQKQRGNQKHHFPMMVTLSWFINNAINSKTITITVNTMSSIIKKIKSVASFSNLKAQISDTVLIPPIIKNTRTTTTELLNLVSDMETELNLMPDSYKNRHKNHPFLNEVLRQVDTRNLLALYESKWHLPPTPRPHLPLANILTGERMLNDNWPENAKECLLETLVLPTLINSE